MVIRTLPRALTVADIMTAHVLAVSPSTSIAGAATLMRDRGVGSALVLDGSRLIGILTERDLVRFAASGASAADTPVAAYMTAEPDTTTPSNEAIEVLRQFVEHGYRHLPVVSRGKVVGIVSMRDVFLKLQRGATTIHLDASPLPTTSPGEPANRTLVDLLEVGHAGDTAVSIPDGPSLTYATLRTHVRQVADVLASLGIRRGDRVAVVTPQTPAAIATVLGTTIAATAAPMNPRLTQDEFTFYLDDVSAKALIVPPHGADAARAAWGDRGPVVEASLSSHGELRLDTRSARQTRATAADPGPDDVALILHSSGTTGRPKRAPLRHRNLVASADNIVRTYTLNASDTAMCVMPLFHVHGLVASVFATLASGGTITIPARFNPLGFRHLLEAQKATWYTAVPSIHQMVLARFRDDEPTPDDRVLRFIRSASAKLRQDTSLQLEERFGVPMLEAYGMTEGSHQIASNPLPPAPREAGSVGRSVGVRVGVMDERGALLTIGASGEVVIQGPNVIDGYDANPAADAAAFTNGWFRTGDLGVLDAAGYLTLVGRLKEMINRGGEKVAPQEIDDVLLQHPAVAEAVSFGVPHTVWGEEVHAVVVLHGEVTERDLIRHCQLHLAEFKLPRRVHFAEAIPRTATGKIQRVRMPALLGIQ
jgi:acyl-CoA synthetase (AMP-forming)/AMP-acid ligase II/CBS domain-containing protein